MARADIADAEAGRDGFAAGASTCGGDGAGEGFASAGTIRPNPSCSVTAETPETTAFPSVLEAISATLLTLARLGPRTPFRRAYQYPPARMAMTTASPASILTRGGRVEVRVPSPLGRSDFARGRGATSSMVGVGVASLGGRVAAAR